MGKRDPRVDAYIAKAAPFAQPVLNGLRELVHEGCPEVEETIKWRSPHFVYKGLFCNMAAFKQHCSFGFWKARLVLDGPKTGEGMGQFGYLRALEDLPPKKVLLGYIRKAAELNAEGVEKPRPRRKKPELATPEELLSALKKNKAARATFDGFSPSKRAEYIEWITAAKTDATRERRLATTLEWLAAGKPLHWKYQK